MKNFLDLEIYQLAYSFAIDTHFLSLKMPKHELYEQGSQLRRSSKSIKDNIAEGYGRRRYKKEYIKFLTYAHASCDESLSQLLMIDQLYNIKGIKELIENNKLLGRKMNKYIQYVENNWRT